MSKINGGITRKALSIRPDAVKGKLPSFDAPKAYMPPMTLATPGGSSDKAVIAMDSALDNLGLFNLVSTGLPGVYGVPQFVGYPVLSNLSQNGLIRAGVESLADEMTRKWIDFQTAGDDDNADTLEALTKEFERVHARQIFNDAANKVGYFGGCLVYLDMGDATDAELLTPLVLSPDKIKKGSLKRLTVIEPINLYPGQYNASDPLSPDYFTPTTWRVLGREIHASRFLYFANNVPPLLLRPAYNFFGIPMAQIALEYVSSFTGNREAAARLLEKFSLTVWSTNMAGFLSGAVGGAEGVDTRVAYAIQQRDNDGCFVLDKESESIEQINTPLSGVTDIVKMSLELLSAIFRIPAVKLFGISPQGFNATGDADMRNWYDHVSSQQEKIFGPPMERLLQVVQLSLFGEVDETISHRWLPLWEMDPAQAATIRKSDVDAAVALVGAGVVDPTEARAKLAKDEDSGWENLDLTVEPVEPNADPVDEGGELGTEAEDKSVSESQHRAMEAAAHGKSTLGIPKKVGEEFVKKDEEE